MKKLLTNILSFSIFAIVLYVVLVIVWGEATPQYYHKNLQYPAGNEGNGFMYHRMQEVDSVANVDILFLGSSHTYRGFDTRLFRNAGYTTFNLGSSNQTPIQTLALLQRHLDRLHPKLVIYEVFPETFEIDGVESSLDILANDRADFFAFNMALKNKHIKPLNAFIYSLYEEITGRKAKTDIAYTKGEDTYIKGGYAEKQYKTYAVPTFPPRTWQLHHQQVRNFEKSLHLLHEKGYEVWLVQAPLTTALYQSIENNDEIDNYFSNQGTYTNFNQLVELSDSLHFYDQEHLNQEGVILFNKKVIALLNQ